jgi:hypothetical protein
LRSWLRFENERDGLGLEDRITDGDRKRSGTELAICNGAPALELDPGNTLVGCSVQETEGREAKHEHGEGALRREVQPNKIL